jgi:hypothetical protein
MNPGCSAINVRSKAAMNPYREGSADKSHTSRRCDLLSMM